MKAPRHREQGKLRRGSRDIKLQLEWIELCGGDLAGYVAKYSKYGDANPAEIYHADLDYLKELTRLFLYPVSDEQKAIEILGEGYFE